MVFPTSRFVLVPIAKKCYDIDLTILACPIVPDRCVRPYVYLFVCAYLTRESISRQ